MSNIFDFSNIFLMIAYGILAFYVPLTKGWSKTLIYLFIIAFGILMGYGFTLTIQSIISDSMAMA